MLATSQCRTVFTDSLSKPAVDQLITKNSRTVATLAAQILMRTYPRRKKHDTNFAMDVYAMLCVRRGGHFLMTMLYTLPIRLVLRFSMFTILFPNSPSISIRPDLSLSGKWRRSFVFPCRVRPECGRALFLGHEIPIP